MLKHTLLSFIAVSVASEAHSQAYEWRDVGGELSIAIVETQAGADEVEVSGFSLDQVGLNIELKTSVQILTDHYPDITRDWFTVDAEGKRISIEPTVEEIWNIVSQDDGVVGLVPVGYSETAGGAEVAGFHKISGVTNKSLFSAPNMDIVLCLDDLQRENHETQNFNVPFLFETKLGPRYSYTYEEGTESIELDHLADSNRWHETFEACQDMIQVGFSLINPLHIMRNNGATSRLVRELPVKLSVQTFPMTAMMFDRNARFSFIRFSDMNPIDAGRILSSRNFQQEGCSRSVSGAMNCEIWATMLTAFDDASMFIRSGPGAEFVQFGKADVISPAVLVLRTRSHDEPPAEMDTSSATEPDLE